jgi:hypothetical protein
MSLGTRLSAAVLSALLPSAAVAKEAVSIGNVKVESKTSTVGRSKGNEYLRVSFAATPNEAVGPKMTILVRAKAKVDGATKVDDIRALGSKLDELSAGQTKDLTVPLFMTEGLGGRPENVELRFSLVRSLDKTGPTLAEFCWTGAKAVEGACAP